MPSGAIAAVDPGLASARVELKTASRQATAACQLCPPDGLALRRSLDATFGLPGLTCRTVMGRPHALHGRMCQVVDPGRGHQLG